MSGETKKNWYCKRCQYIGATHAHKRPDGDLCAGGDEHMVWMQKGEPPLPFPASISWDVAGPGGDFSGVAICENGKWRQATDEEMAHFTGADLEDVPEPSPEAKKFHARLVALDENKERELARLDGVAGHDAELARHIIRLSYDLRDCMEYWNYTTPLRSPEDRAEVLFSLAGEVFSTALIGLKHRTLLERSHILWKGIQNSLQLLMRRKLIPVIPRAPAPPEREQPDKLSAAFLGPDGQPLRRTKH